MNLTSTFNFLNVLITLVQILHFLIFSLFSIVFFQLLILFQFILLSLHLLFILIYFIVSRMNILSLFFRNNCLSLLFIFQWIILCNILTAILTLRFFFYFILLIMFNLITLCFLILLIIFFSRIHSFLFLFLLNLMCFLVFLVFLMIFFSISCRNIYITAFLILDIFLFLTSSYFILSLTLYPPFRFISYLILLISCNNHNNIWNIFLICFYSIRFNFFLLRRLCTFNVFLRIRGEYFNRDSFATLKKIYSRRRFIILLPSRTLLRFSTFC